MILGLCPRSFKAWVHFKPEQYPFVLWTSTCAMGRCRHSALAYDVFLPPPQPPQPLLGAHVYYSYGTGVSLHIDAGIQHTSLCGYSCIPHTHHSWCVCVCVYYTTSSAPATSHAALNARIYIQMMHVYHIQDALQEWCVEYTNNKSWCTERLMQVYLSYSTHTITQLQTLHLPKDTHWSTPPSPMCLPT
jgi:hypothetical protein